MEANLSDSVTTRPWRLEKRVLPQHTDHAGVMWHGAYVAWMEEARVEALAAAGLGYAAMASMGIEMPVVSLSVDYRHALRHGDVVVLASNCLRPSGVRWPWRCSLLLDGRVMAEGAVDLVMVRQGRVLRRAPAEVAAVMERLSQGPPRR